MTKKKTKKNNLEQEKKQKIRKPIYEKLNLKQETMHFIYALFFVLFGIFFIAAAFNAAGILGKKIFTGITKYFGIGYYIFPLLMFLIAAVFFKGKKQDFTKIKSVGALIFAISSLGLVQLISGEAGVVGAWLTSIKEYIGPWMSGLFYFTFLIISLVIVFDGIPILKKKVEEFSESLTEDEEEKIDRIQKEAMEKAKADLKAQKKIGNSEKTFSVSGISEKIEKIATKKTEKKSEEKTFADSIKENLLKKNSSDVILPPTSLLSKDKGKASAGDIKENANIIKNTLASFGISVEIDSVMVGPTVTRYALKPAQGVKLSKIASLSDNLALALAAKSIVIQAPIPGQALVGIEIPNKNTAMVGAGSLFESQEFVNSPFTLPLAIGKNIAGNPEIIGLDKAPHILVAGQTGAGKSVTVHALITSLLYKYGPNMLKFILVDPKQVEMTLYDGIPHLFTPVIVDAKKAILALRWAVNEMERRYALMREHAVRDIDSYHKNIVEKAKAKAVAEEEMPEQIPYIVIVIDELSDIMSQYPKELEAGIVAIAQKARAVGIHLILSTQRPSVNVVTGLIKANVPTRIALSVSSAIDSKTILDQAGAEKLLGKGDMLYKTGSMPKPVRVQSSFISEEEVKKVVKFLKNAYKNELGEAGLDFSDPSEKRAEEVEVPIGEEMPSPSQQAEDLDFIDGVEKQEQNIGGIDFDSLEEDENLDELFNDAKNEVITSGKASTSYLQRKFSIGYSRAAKLIDQLEEKGIIGPANGSKPREVLIKE